jgi:CheY-specific phosphatase CheX
MPETGAEIAKWAELLEEATREVFSMMLGCEVISDIGRSNSEMKPAMMPTDHGTSPLIEVLFTSVSGARREADAEITAVVGLAGELCGVLNFACGTAAAKMMAACMLGIEEAEAGEQQWDAIGEIANMIAGNFKAKLPGIGERCLLSVPTIVAGSNYRLRTVVGKRRLEYRFLVNSASAHVTLEIQQ